MYEDEKEVKKKEGVRVSSLGGDNISLAHLTEEEVENIEGMVHNHFWVSVSNDGRLEVVRRKEKLPSPTEDEDMLPFWRQATPGTQQLQLFNVKVDEYSSPSIIIQYLCGYNYSPENYKFQAQKLESYGFECMRSRRGNDATYWELWFLPSVWSAKGALWETIKKFETNNNKKKLQEAISFLCHNVLFGTLDIAFQRAAMTMDD